ncbi:MAG: TIGR04076 family protein, partial [Desulfovibrionaceae bacterium]|nr:TIGR04076 family protein [Desulfovibrionaceae bacterium]
MTRRNFIQGGTAAACGLTLAAADAARAGTAQSAAAVSETEQGAGGAAMKHKCRITVLRRELYQDLQQQYLADPESGKCPFFKDGQEIMVDSDGFFRMLHGSFCSEAWDCISRYVYA